MRIHHLLISQGHNYFGHHQQPAGENPVVEVDAMECVAGCGVRGDRFFGYKENYKGQITFFSMETFDRMRRELGLDSASPRSLRRNVLVSGLDLAECIGREFTVQGVRFEGVEECRPCYWMNRALGPGAEEWLRGRGGLRARILTGGMLRRDGVLPGFSAVILAGGASSRMGTDKALLKVGDRSLLALQVERALSAGAAEVFISGRANTRYEVMARQVLLDQWPNSGPLAGIERALEAARENLVLVLAVDMPVMSAEFLGWLRSQCDSSIGAAPMVQGQPEPMAAFFPKGARSIALEMLSERHLSVRQFADRCAESGLVRRVDVPEGWISCFANWNTPNDISLTAGL